MRSPPGSIGDLVHLMPGWRRDIFGDALLTPPIPRTFPPGEIAAGAAPIAAPRQSASHGDR